MKKVFKNIVAWLYIMFFIVQAISILSAFIIQNEFVTSTLPFFRFWNAIGRSIFENWLPFSIIFVMIFVGGVLSSQIKLETNISKHFYNFILLCINLFLCNRLYETIVFQEKIEYISKHFWGVLCFVLAIAIVILVGHALKKAREARNSYTKNPPSHSAAVDDRDEIARNANGLQSNIQDELFMKRYPISYIWLNFKYYLSRKKEIKYQKQAEYHEAKYSNNTLPELDESKIEIITDGATKFIFVPENLCLFKFCSDEENRNSSNNFSIEKALQIGLLPSKGATIKKICKERNSHKIGIHFFVTTNCNMKCTYCVFRNEKKIQNNDSFNFDTICDKILQIISITRPDEIDFTFTGGEPLLKFDRIILIANYVETYCLKEGIKYTFQITTNGSILNKKMFARCKMKLK